MNYLDCVKPMKNISKIIKSLKPHSDIIFLTAGKKINWIDSDVSYIYILDEGSISIMKGDSNVLISRVSQQHILGFAEYFQSGISRTYFRVDEKSIVYKIKTIRAIEIIDEKCLWKDVAILLSFHINYLCYRDARLMHSRAYSIIKNCLEELYIGYDEDMRMNIKIINYIQERTFLSRSSILNVISALNQGGYITLRSGGYLVDIKKLPHGF
ncbi:helix-turn-helix domain-containing protein [Enterobacter cloacae subsp. cloacae]|uniref:helix-turn-helix domain-containing protein n=1 Tax=Enterobacter cloacae TaxID=550 RepID=UPI001C5BF1C9|nr:helix-turn-helix domain-containing protein [Enterobacter cloacae]MBW4217883.1 helix-turn-helix domain-containing protein [Enterobacter cloacae subsp. cloacae]